MLLLWRFSPSLIKIDHSRNTKKQTFYQNRWFFIKFGFFINLKEEEEESDRLMGQVMRKPEWERWRREEGAL